MSHGRRGSGHSRVYPRPLLLATHSVFVIISSTCDLFVSPIALLLVSSIGVSGDTLLLKNGRKIDGRYLSSDADRVQFEVNGKPFTYAVWLIRELRFSGVEPAHDEVRPAGKPQQEAFCQVLIDFQRERRRVASDPNPIRRAQMQPPDPWTFESRLIAVLVRTASFPIGPAGCSSRFRDRAYRLTSSPIARRVLRLSASPTVIQPSAGLLPARPVSLCRLLWRDNSAEEKRVLSIGSGDTCFSGPQSVRTEFEESFGIRLRSIHADGLKPHRLERLPMSAILSIWLSFRRFSPSLGPLRHIFF